VALTRADAEGFGAACVHPRTGSPATASVRIAARTALHAWGCALQASGRPVPAWSPPREDRPLPRLLTEYRDFRLIHRGVTLRTVQLELETASGFLSFLRSRHRTLSTTRLADVDAFVMALSRRLCRRTTAGTCSLLRSFLRFLQATGRVRRDLAGLVIAPRIRPMDRPPRALPWPQVRRLLSGVKRDRPVGRRDFAILLLMATYGLGGGEVGGLRLEDVDWRARTLHVRRPKTGVSIVLPLLPTVARALASYLRHGRPHHAPGREVFVTVVLPHRKLSCSAICQLVREHARAVGIAADRLGAHVLRHSHACRQVEIGSPPKVLGDILGHRRPSSTSVYVRIALSKLRRVGLPVPR
jgi:site-specific recombinase XerD